MGVKQLCGKGPGDTGCQHTHCQLCGKIPGQGTAETLISVVSSDRRLQREIWNFHPNKRKKPFLIVAKEVKHQSGCRVSALGCSVPIWTQPWWTCSCSGWACFGQGGWTKQSAEDHSTLWFSNLYWIYISILTAAPKPQRISTLQ